MNRTATVPDFLDFARGILRMQTPLQARPPSSFQAHLSPHSMSFSTLNSPFSYLQPNECRHFTWNILHCHPFLVLTTTYFSTLSLPPGFFPGPQIGLDAKAVSSNNILSEPDHTSILADCKLREWKEAFVLFTTTSPMPGRVLSR